MAGMNRMTEAQMREAYKFVVEHAFTLSRKQMAEELELSVASINGMMKRLEKAGLDLPKGIKTNILTDNLFVEELKALAEEHRPTG